jgi:hypothetical protein
LYILASGDYHGAHYQHSPEGTSLHCGEVSIYQESSGGENWRSENHLDRYGKVPLNHRGYRVIQSGAVVAEGVRAEPFVRGEFGEDAVSCVVPEFWQRFPLKLSVDPVRGVGISLTPEEFPGEIELQGGEKRSLKIFFSLTGEDISAFHFPLVATLPQERLYYAEIPVSSGSGIREYEELCQLALSGPRNFFFVPQRERVVRKLKVAVSVISAILILVIGFFI